MERFSYSAVIAKNPEEKTAAPIYVGQIELDYQPQLEYTICLSTALIERWGGPKSTEPYLWFVVDDIVLCDKSASTPVLILRPRRKESIAALNENLAAAKRTTR
ncbi:MAG: hypothetical protein NTX14_00245 [Candidatus Nealsonbacteria bacterium]|nr:hypothetical protein [Candidatus Nealsonbacteria bacterium]